MWLVLTTAALAWELLGPEGKGTGADVPTGTFFAPNSAAWAHARIITDPAALGREARSVLRYIDTYGANDPAASADLFGELGISPERSRATLEFIARTAEENPALLRDPTWLFAHFDRLRWTSAHPGGMVRLTRYLVAQAEGCAVRTAICDQALWVDPGEPWRSQYTRREVFEGALLSGEVASHSRPLVWLREADVHDALMQGTTAVRLADGSTRTFSVDVANGRAYEPGKKGRAQDRFWYFREVDGPRGWGIDPADRIPLEAGVAVAGDVYNLGVGRLFLVEAPTHDGRVDLRLAILADTGGAFQPNLGQLDWFSGAFPSHAAMYAAWKGLPDRAHVDVLALRR